jgi:MFS family permease
MCTSVADVRGALRVRDRARGAARANLAGALGQVLVTYCAPGSVLLTLFLQEWLHAAKWQIGLVMTMTYLGPTLEPPGAYLAERLGRRRPLFLCGFLVNRLGFLPLALIPLLGTTQPARDCGILLVLAVIALTRVGCHLATPAWWSWMADLVPERRRGRFFACRNQCASAVAAASFFVALTLLQFTGGMSNAALVSVLFSIGTVCGVADILMYLRVPEPPRQQARLVAPGLDALTAPFRSRAFRRLILGMGLWSFSSNLLLPFLPVFQRGETLAGHRLGLGVSWLFLALLNVLTSVAAMLTSRRWPRWVRSPRRLLLLGSGYLFVNLFYLFVGPGQTLGLLLAVVLVGGACNAAWTVAGNQLLLAVSPREGRSYYVSAYDAVNGWMMAGGPLLGGLLADALPVLGWDLPGGLPCCYFHLLLLLSCAGGALALVLLAGVRSQPEEPPAVRAALPAPLLLRRRVRLKWTRSGPVLMHTAEPEAPAQEKPCPIRS